MTRSRQTLVGKCVEFLSDELGASRSPDELFVVTDEVYGIGDSGTVAFPHPNPKLKGWWYVEVDSKAEPGEKRYVGVHVSQFRERKE